MNASRPCPWVGCRYHLFEEIAPRILGIPRSKLEEVDDDRLVDVLLGMEYSCALDWASKGTNTLEEIGRMFGVTRERVRQIQSKGLRKLASRCKSRRKDIVDLLQSLGEKKGVLEWK